MKTNILRLSVLTACLLQSTIAYAEEMELDPIVVSSDFRAKTLSKTSNSVTVLGEDKIADKASLSFEDIVGKAPNVNFTSGASRAHYVQIRGIGERSQFISPVNPSVGLMIDGIDVSDSALALSMFDVRQIEILRGPQGTTFGANGMAGLVSLQSNEPTAETQGHIEATAGNYNTKAFGFAIGGSIIEDVLLSRFSLYSNESDGFSENTFLDKDDTQNIDELTAKAQFRLLLNKDHTIDLNILHIDINNGYDAFNFDNSRKTRSDEPGKDTQETDAFAIKSTYNIDDIMHLETKVSLQKSHMQYSFDVDWSHKGAFSKDAYPYSAFDKYERDRKKADFDIRLISDKAGRIFSGSTDWTLGAYYKKQDENLLRNYTYLDTPYTSSFDTKSMAAYGQLCAKLSEKLTFIVGMRIEKWDAEFVDSDAMLIDTDETLLGGKLGLTYHQDVNNLHYVTLSKGYKPGGINADNSLSDNQREFKTEHLWNLDIGRTSSHFNGALKSRVNLFYGLREDQQVKSSVVQVREDASTDFTDYLANAAKGKYYGLESQVDYYANDDLHLFLSLGLLKAKFDEYTDPNPDSEDVNGRAPAQSPEYQYNIGFNYNIIENVSLKADVEGRGSYYFSNRHNEKADSYTLVNSSITYTGESWSATLWGRNLTDETYQVRGFGSFGNNPGNGYETELYTQQGSPRTFGFTVGYDF